MENNPAGPINLHSETTIQQTPVIAEKPKPSKRRWLLIILGLVEIIPPFIVMFLIFPNLGLLYKSLNLNIPINFYLGFFLFGLALLIAVSQLIIGIFSLDTKIGKRKTSALIILGLVSVFLIPAIMMFSIINNIYYLISTIK